jgi:hypothetical protein
MLRISKVIRTETAHFGSWYQRSGYGHLEDARFGKRTWIGNLVIEGL